MDQLILDKIEENKPSFDSISCEYSQEGDCCQDSMEIQSIKFETCNNGVSSFYRMSLPEGGYWSFDSEEDLINLFRDFKSRFVQECEIKKEDKHENSSME